LHDCARGLGYLQESFVLAFTVDGFQVGLLEAIQPTPWSAMPARRWPTRWPLLLVNLGIDLVHVENSAPGPLEVLLEC